MENNLLFLSGKPINFQGHFQIYQPSLSEISEIGIQNFYRSVKILTLTETQIEEIISETKIPAPLDPLKYILTQIQNPIIFLELQLAFLSFIKKPIKLVQDSFGVTIDEQNDFIFTSSSFKEFQSIIRTVVGIEQEEELEINTDDEAMRKKFLEKRRLLKKAKEKQQKKKTVTGKGLSLEDEIMAVCTYNSGYTLDNIWNLTLYQLHLQFKQCQKKDRFEHDYQALLSGADKKKIHLTDWIKI